MLSFADLPLEILAIVLDYLPQHHVYRFLSLSKGVNYFARRRLLRQVYVLARGRPVLHNHNKDLVQWLFVSCTQFKMLIEQKFEWPGKLVQFERLTMRLIDIQERCAPAEIVNCNEYRVFIPRLPVLHTTVPWLAQLKLIGPHTYEPIPVKLRVDKLLVWGDARGIDDCIDLSSVKQLSLVDAYDNFEGNIYNLATQLSGLEDLFIRQSNLKSRMLQNFPKTIKRLVVNDVQGDPIYRVMRFWGLLEYLEIGTGACLDNWPRPIRLPNSLFTDTYEQWYPSGSFPRLKLLVRGGKVYAKKYPSGEYQKFRLIAGYHQLKFLLRDHRFVKHHQ